MELQKNKMQEAAILYYEKNCTQNEIAKIMNLSRQTVSKLLNEAKREKIVEIKINNPETTCSELEKDIKARFGIKNAVVCGVSSSNEGLRQLMTVKKAIFYIEPILKEGNKKIALSWGRTIQSLISEIESIGASGNIVFPLFGATDQEEDYYSSNELARTFADKIGAKVKYAWFPYKPDSVEDGLLFKKTSYYKKIDDLWNNIDISIVGLGNRKIIQTFGSIFGYNEKCSSAIGDIATHFFNANGEFVELYENTLCASLENLKKSKEIVAIASGDNKCEAIIGALKSGILTTLVTDEYTARELLSC